MNNIKLFIAFYFLAGVIFSQSIIESSGIKYNFDLKGIKIAVIMGKQVEHNEAVIIPGLWKEWGAKIIYVGPSKVIPSHSLEMGKEGLTQTSNNVNVDILIDDFRSQDADVIYFPGGKSPDYLLANNKDKIVDMIRQADKAKKFIAGFCHGPLVILEAGIVVGKKITGEVTEEEVSKAKGIFVHEKAIADKNIITGNFPFLETFALTVAEKLNPKNSRIKYEDPFLTNLDFAFPTSEVFKKTPIPITTLEKIVQASALTNQDYVINVLKPWHVTAITGEPLIIQLQDIFSKSLEKFYTAEGVDAKLVKTHIERHIKGTVYLVVTMKNELLESRAGTFIVNADLKTKMLSLSAGAFIDNLRSAANKLGLGTNLMNGLPVLLAESEIRQLLKITDDTFIGGIVAIGYPVESNFSQPLRPVAENLTIIK